MTIKYMVTIDFKSDILKLEKKSSKAFIDLYFLSELGTNDNGIIVEKLKNDPKFIVWNNLNRIIRLGETYSRIITFEGFQEFIKNEYEFSNSSVEGVYSLIYELSLKDISIIGKLEKNYEINFGGTFKFYQINLSKFNNNTDDFLDSFKENIKNINHEFSVFAQTTTLIFPYSEDGKYIEDFLVYYSSQKKNKELTGLGTKEKMIDSSNSFYFFFQEISGIYFLVLRQPFHHSRVDYLFKAINKVLGSICSYIPFDLINFSQIKNGKIFNKIDLEVTGIKLRKTDISSSILMEGTSCLLDFGIEFGSSLDKVHIEEIGFNHKRYEGKDLKISVSGGIKTDQIRINQNDRVIREIIALFLNESIQLIGSNLEDVFSWNEFYKELLFGENIFYKSSYNESYNELNQYILSREYCGDNIEGGKGRILDEHSININTNTVSLLGSTDKLKGTIKLKFDHQTILQKKLFDKIQYIFSGKVGVMTFSVKTYSNLTILFADNFGDITNYLAENSKKDKKYLFFSGTEFTLAQKVNLAETYHASGFNRNDLNNLFGDIIGFIKEEAGRIVLNGELGKDDLSGDKRELVDFGIISKSGDGDAFENAIARVLPKFFHFFMQFGNKYIGKTIPDGIIKSKGEDGNTLVALYDAKSSGRIISYINKDSRKIDDYIGLFPKNNNNNCVFIIFGPEVSISEIEDLKDHPIWKKAIEDNKGKILYVSSKILDFFGYISRFEDFGGVRGYLNMEKVTQHLLDEVKIPSIKYLDIKKLQEEIIDTYLGDPSEVDKEIGKKLKSRTNGKLNLSEKHTQFKEYIRNFGCDD